MKAIPTLIRWLSGFTLVLGAVGPGWLAAADPLPEGFRGLQIGDPAPDFRLPGIDGREWGLADFAAAEVLMVLFTSNHCPTSHGIEARLQQLWEDFQGKSFALVAINPNHPMGMSLEELGYGKYTDSFDDMKRYAGDLGWQFPYIYDGETQQVARAYGCLATPHVFLFDRERKLRYMGRFDDSRYPDPATVKSPDARNAVEALLAGRPAPVEVTRPHGCSTKWKERHEWVVKQAEANWEARPVSVAEIDAAGVAALRANPAGRLRLFNVWATWCAPCVEEFPELVRLLRMYGGRNFELITVSMDDPGEASRVQAFLEKQKAGLPAAAQRRAEAEGRKTNHFLFTGANPDDLVAALDPEWPGPLPHSVLVGPDGTVLLRHNGIIDPEVFQAKIVEVLTPYWEERR